MTLEERVTRIETILALALHTWDGPDQKMEPAEFARYRLLLHELRTVVSTAAEHRRVQPL